MRRQAASLTGEFRARTFSEATAESMHAQNAAATNNPVCSGREETIYKMNLDCLCRATGKFAALLFDFEDTSFDCNKHNVVFRHNGTFNAELQSRDGVVHVYRHRNFVPLKAYYISTLAIMMCVSVCFGLHKLGCSYGNRHSRW